MGVLEEIDAKARKEAISVAQVTAKTKGGKGKKPLPRQVNAVAGSQVEQRDYNEGSFQTRQGLLMTTKGDHGQREDEEPNTHVFNGEVPQDQTDQFKTTLQNRVPVSQINTNAVQMVP